MGELGSDDTGVAMRADHFAPDDSDFGPADLLLSFVDICDALAEVEVGGCGVIDAFDLDQACLGVGRVLVPDI